MIKINKYNTMLRWGTAPFIGIVSGYSASDDAYEGRSTPAEQCAAVDGAHAKKAVPLSPHPGSFLTVHRRERPVVADIQT